MLELAVVLPLAQLNSTGGAPATGAAAPSAPPAPAAPESATGATSGPGVTSTSAPGGPTSTSQPAPGPNYLPFITMGVMLVALYFFMMRPQRKEEKRRKAMISEVKKGDRVMTIGGMLAKVVSVEGDEVVLKIDEAANVKATYRKTAIQEVIDRDEKK